MRRRQDWSPHEGPGGHPLYPPFQKMATELVGDGKKPNLYFLSRQGTIVGVLTEFGIAYYLWQSISEGRSYETALEDRQFGVIASVEPDEERGNRLTARDDAALFREYQKPVEGVFAKYKPFQKMATDLVGDGKKPNLFFVSIDGMTYGVFTEFGIAYETWSKVAREIRPNSALEDRFFGVIASIEPADEHETKLIKIDNSGDFTRMYGNS